MDVLDFANFVLYPPNLPTDVRIDTANRLVKYSRQKKSQIESTKKEKEVAGYDNEKRVCFVCYTILQLYGKMFIS